MISTNIKDLLCYDMLFNAIDEFTYTTGNYPNYLIMSRGTFYDLHRDYHHGVKHVQMSNSGEYLFNGFPVAFNDALETGRIDVV